MACVTINSPVTLLPYASELLNKAVGPAHALGSGWRALDIGRVACSYLNKAPCTVERANPIDLCSGCDAFRHVGAYQAVVAIGAINSDHSRAAHALRCAVRLLAPKGVLVLAWLQTADELTVCSVARAVGLADYFVRFGYEHSADGACFGLWAVRDVTAFGVGVLDADARAVRAMETAYESPDLPRGPARHSRTRHYHTLLDRYREASDVRYLELAPQCRSALHAARAYLPRAMIVVGVVELATDKTWAAPDDDIYVEHGPLDSAPFLRVVTARHGPFDVVIDSEREPDTAYHRDAVAAFEVLFPLLKDGGIYIVEPQADDAKTSGSCYDYFAGRARALNRRVPVTRAHPRTLAGCADPDKIVAPGDVTDAIECAIDTVNFVGAAIAITKRVRRHWLPAGEPVPPSVCF